MSLRLEKTFRASKMNFFGVKEFSLRILISKIDVKMNLRSITKSHAAATYIGFLTKSITKSNGRATAMPPAWELKYMPISRCLKILFSKTKISYPILSYWTLSKNLRALLADYSRNSL